MFHWYKKKSFLAIDITDNELILSALEMSKGILHIVGHQRVPLDHETYQLTVFNSTALLSYIQSFIVKHKLAKVSAGISLHNPVFFETLTPAITPEIETSLKDFVWHYIPLIHSEQQYYIAAIAHNLLMQYQLIALRAELNLIALTTRIMSYYSLINNNSPQELQLPSVITITNLSEVVYKTAQAQLAKQSYVINNFSIAEQPLLIALGLCYLGKNHEIF